MSQATKTAPKREVASPPRKSARYFDPHPTKPGIGRPAAGAAATHVARGGGGR